MVVVYKIDRLTRSLFDFAKIVEIFDAASVWFVSVTQSFNTTTSMGRLTLNVLLSFAQFEREVTGERIRDKVAASKKKGMWMGGNVPLGYNLKDRMLVVNAAEAQTVVTIFEQYAELGAVRKVKQAIDCIGLRTKLQNKRDRRCGEGDRWRAVHDRSSLYHPQQPALHRQGPSQGTHPSRRALGHPLRGTLAPRAGKACCKFRRARSRNGRQEPKPACWTDLWR